MDRKQSSCEREAPLPLPTPKTECRSCPHQSAKKRRIMNCNRLGGLAKCSEENLVDNLTIEHIANQCCVSFASHRVDCEIKTKLSPDTIACPTKLNKSSLHQVAQVFKAAGKKNPDNLLHEEVQRDCNDLKERPAAALKEIRQLGKKDMWNECLKSKCKRGTNHSMRLGAWMQTKSHQRNHQVQGKCLLEKRSDG